jgi:hypothetical protein
VGGLHRQLAQQRFRCRPPANTSAECVTQGRTGAGTPREALSDNLRRAIAPASASHLCAQRRSNSGIFSRLLRLCTSARLVSFERSVFCSPFPLLGEFPHGHRLFSSMSENFPNSY